MRTIKFLFLITFPLLIFSCESYYDWKMSTSIKKVCGESNALYIQNDTTNRFFIYQKATTIYKYDIISKSNDKTFSNVESAKSVNGSSIYITDDKNIIKYSCKTFSIDTIDSGKILIRNENNIIYASDRDTLIWRFCYKDENSNLIVERGGTVLNYTDENILYYYLNNIETANSEVRHRNDCYSWHVYNVSDDIDHSIELDRKGKNPMEVTYELFDTKMTIFEYYNDINKYGVYFYDFYSTDVVPCFALIDRHQKKNDYFEFNNQYEIYRYKNDGTLISKNLTVDGFIRNNQIHRDNILVQYGEKHEHFGQDYKESLFYFGEDNCLSYFDEETQTSKILSTDNYDIDGNQYHLFIHTNDVTLSPNKETIMFVADDGKLFPDDVYLIIMDVFSYDMHILAVGSSIWKDEHNFKVNYKDGRTTRFDFNGNKTSGNVDDIIWDWLWD